MALKISCPECGKQLKITIEHAGKRAKCSGCGNTIRLPSREKIEAHLAGMSAGAAAPATPPPPPAPSPPPAPAAEEPAWDDDFNLDEPLAGGASTESIGANPFASPIAADSTSLPDPTSPTGRLEYAGFGTRWVAAIIDGLILIGLNLGIGFAFGIAWFAMFGDGGGDGSALELFANVIGFVVQLLYFAGLESSAKGATLGKQAMGIRVVSTSGERISFLRAVGRWFAEFLSALILMIGFLMAAFTERKQALHDIIAGTLVVKA
ncbi:MAG: RDD family protein [Planctomycetota bacterium]